jgi:hypothetical protein
MSDIEIENHGSIWLVRPLTQHATEWLHVNVQADAQWFGGALVVEPRYVANLVNGLSEEGSLSPDGADDRRHASPDLGAAPADHRDPPAPGGKTAGRATTPRHCRGATGLVTGDNFSVRRCVLHTGSGAVGRRYSPDQSGEPGGEGAARAAVSG